MYRHLLPLTAATLATSLIACHTDIPTENSASAGDPDQILTDSGADTPDDPDFNPLDYCTNKPDEDFEGTIQRCEGDLPIR